MDFKLTDTASHEITMKNKYDFRTLEFLDIQTKIYADDQVIFQGKMAGPKVGPGQQEKFKLGIQGMQPGKEYFVNFYAVTNKDDGIIPKGTILASEQIALPEKCRRLPSCSAARQP